MTGSQHSRRQPCLMHCCSQTSNSNSSNSCSRRSKAYAKGAAGSDLPSATNATPPPPPLNPPPLMPLLGAGMPLVYPGPLTPHAYLRKLFFSFLFSRTQSRTCFSPVFVHEQDGLRTAFLPTACVCILVTHPGHIVQVLHIRPHNLPVEASVLKEHLQQKCPLFKQLLMLAI